MTPRQRGDRSQLQKCAGDQCNYDGVAPANCESFLHLIFDRIDRGWDLFVQPVTAFDDFRPKQAAYSQCA
jgi:hypothetical protein